VNLDELFAKIEEDTLRDARALSPMDYAKMRHIYPQRVYKALRNGQLERRVCLCGRLVVDVVEADEFFGFKSEEDDTDEAEDVQEQ